MTEVFSAFSLGFFAGAFFMLLFLALMGALSVGATPQG